MKFVVEHGILMDHRQRFSFENLLHYYKFYYSPSSFKYPVNTDRLLRLANLMGIDVNDQMEKLALHRAADIKNEKQVELLLETGAFDVNARNTQNNTPLHLAFNYPGFDKSRVNKIARLLVDRGIKFKRHCFGKNYSETYFFFFVTIFSIKFVQITKGADIRAVNDFGYTPMHLAMKNGYVESVDMLLAKITGLNEKKFKGNSGLENWLANNDDEPIELICELSVATILGYDEVADRLIDLGYNDEQKEDFFQLRKIPLYYAVTEKRVNIAKMLIEVACHRLGLIIIISFFFLILVYLAHLFCLRLNVLKIFNMKCIH